MVALCAIAMALPQMKGMGGMGGKGGKSGKSGKEGKGDGDITKQPKEDTASKGSSILQSILQGFSMGGF